MICWHSCCFSLLNMQARGFRLPGLSVMLSLRESYVTDRISMHLFPKRENWGIQPENELHRINLSIWPRMHRTEVSSSFSILSSWFEDLNLLKVQSDTVFCSTHICSTCQWLPEAELLFPVPQVSLIFLCCVSCSGSNDCEASGCVRSFLKFKRKWTLV